MNRVGTPSTEPRRKRGAFRFATFLAASTALLISAGGASGYVAAPMSATSTTNGGGTCVAAETTVTCTYTTVGPDSFTVPSGVAFINVRVVGGDGGSNDGTTGGRGAVVTTSGIPTSGFTSPIVLHIGGAGGWGGYEWAGSGGGSSDVAPASPYRVIAGGGGGAGAGPFPYAGTGGSAGLAGGAGGDGGELGGRGGAGGLGGDGGGGSSTAGSPGNGGAGGLAGGREGTCGTHGDGGTGEGSGVGGDGACLISAPSSGGGGGGGGYGGGGGGGVAGSSIGGGGGGGGSVGPSASGTATAYATRDDAATGPGGSITVTYDKVSQPIVFTSTAPTDASVGGTYTPTARGGASLNPVTVAIAAEAASVCTISGSTVTFTGVGTCTINANQDGNSEYLAATLTQQVITVAQAPQTITFTSIAPSPTFGTSATYTPTADGGASGNPVTFAIATASIGICRLESSTVHFDHGGTCTIEAHQAGNGDYQDATVDFQSITIAQATQTVAFTSTVPTNAIADGSTYTPTATSSSGLAVTFASTSGACSVSSGIVHLDRAGTCTISANQAGNSDYLAVPIAQQSFDIAAAPVPAAPTATTPLSTSIPLAATSTTTATTITTTFTAPGPGQASQTGTTPTAKDTRGKAIKVCSASKKITKAGKVTLTCTLTKAAKTLRKKNRLTVLLTTTFTPTSGTKAISTKTIKLGRK